MQRIQKSGVLAGENEVWWMLKQEDFSSYAFTTMKDLVEDPYPYYILLGATKLTQCH